MNFDARSDQVVIGKEDAAYQRLERFHKRRKHVVRLNLPSTGVIQIMALNLRSYPVIGKTIDLFDASGEAAIKPLLVAVKRKTGACSAPSRSP